MGSVTGKDFVRIVTETAQSPRDVKASSMASRIDCSVPGATGVSTLIRHVSQVFHE